MRFSKYHFQTTDSILETRYIRRSSAQYSTHAEIQNADRYLKIRSEESSAYHHAIATAHSKCYCHRRFVANFTEPNAPCAIVYSQTYILCVDDKEPMCCQHKVRTGASQMRARWVEQPPLHRRVPLSVHSSEENLVYGTFLHLCQKVFDLAERGW